MKCELCGKVLRNGDTIHGIKYGSLANGGFVPAKDSAVTVICGPCGNLIYGLVYASFEQRKLAYPSIIKLYEELTGIMKNGWKVIQAISKLPVTDQTAIKHLIESCKSAK